MFSRKELTEQIRSMGIRPDDTVLIHTSMRAIGQVEDGADGVIDAFREVLSEGLFLVPTHTWASVNRANPHYDVRLTRPCIGALPTVAAFRPDGIRSLHPTHSMWAAGKGAEEFLAGEENAPTPGAPGFAWARLADAHAKILLIGIGHERNTFIHAVEEMADIPDRLSQPFDVSITDRNGNTFRHSYRNHFCSRSEHVSDQFVNFEKPLLDLGAQEWSKLGNADVRIIDAAKCREIILRIYSRTKEDLCIEVKEIPEELYK